MNKQHQTQFIKQTVSELGFDYCGIARAEQLDEDARRLEQWLHQGRHGNMAYMENYFDLRIDPRKLVPGARSVITVLQNYYPSEEQVPGAPKISKYAYGKDYHTVIKSKLKDLTDRMRTNIGDINGRGFIDSAPVLERAWHKKADWAGWGKTAIC